MGRAEKASKEALGFLPEQRVHGGPDTETDTA
jgi:hypothetical protein